MYSPTVRSRRARSAYAATLAGAALAAATALGPATAHAHFILQAPACYADQDGLGSPQKSAPCGQADPGSPLHENGSVTTYHEGELITVTIKEVIAHPGHYRVAIADSPDKLPADPPVTAGTTPCGSTVIESSPMLPLLADGLLVHTMPFTGPQSVSVQLPPGLTCTKCTLQVIEFMSNHPLNNPGGCFYHHCATVTILPAVDGGMSSDGGSPTDGGGAADGGMSRDGGSTSDGGTRPGDGGTRPGDGGTRPSDGGSAQDAGTMGAPDAATGGMPPPPGGCGCRMTAASAAGVAPISGLLTLALLLRRRRARG
jgi:hypothetical protein